MNILILSTSHPYRMAGILAKDLFDGLRTMEGNKVKLVVKEWDSYPDKDIIPIDSRTNYYWNWFFTKAVNALRRLRIVKKKVLTTDQDYSLQDLDQTITTYSTEKILRKVGFNPDAIITVFLQRFLSFKNLYELNQITRAPIIMYMMDMAPMTGGCHYAWDCKKYTTQCGSCPALYSTNPNDQTTINFAFKKLYSEKTRIIAVACSTNHRNQLMKSVLYKEKETYAVIEPIDESLYAPGDKKSTRKTLNLPLDKKIIFFGSVALWDRRKGFTKFCAALEILKGMITPEENNEIHLVIAGKINDESNLNFPFSYTLLGYMPHNEFPKAYQAADVYVCSSIEDAGPMMINQSIMCGTPVVSFDVGVASDLVKQGSTGYIARSFEPADMAKGIYEILMLSESDYDQVQTNCRNLAMNTFSTKKVASNFADILMTAINK